MIQDTSSKHRSTISLNGEWTFTTDPDNRGLEDGWPTSDANWPDTEPVNVPHSWQETDLYREYTGVAWYRHKFECNTITDESRSFIRFGAVDYEATVWVNGSRVGTNREGYLPFEFEVTDVIEDGKNTVIVRVDDPKDISEIPHGKQAEPWYTRVSGIWQGVKLEQRPPIYVSDVRITPDVHEDVATFDVTTTAGADTTEWCTKITVTKNGDKIVEEGCDLAGGTGNCIVSIPDPEYWTPESPSLYDITVQLLEDGVVVDEYEEYFGMRTIDWDGEQLYLNGERYYIRGALDQAYYPETLYRPFEDDIFEREVRLAKDLGFNLIRKHIKPAHPEFIETADRIGVLVWEEPANPTIYTERSKHEVREQLKRLIERDYNRPSVVIWSIYNEEWGIGLDQQDYSDHPGRLWNDPEKQKFLTNLYEEAGEWDPTRPICDNSGWAHVATDINDYHRYFVSPDRAEPWREDLTHIVDHPADNYAVENTPASDAPILISEFGTWGLCDIPRLRERYSGDPPWFSHDFLDDPLKRPAGVDERYESTNLPDVFNGYSDLAAAWQARECASVTDIIETMRTHDGIAGYVITEFSDIEWEFNGILDHWREPKRFANEFAVVNDNLLVVIKPETHVVTAGERLTVDFIIVNDTGEQVTGTLRWEGFGENSSQSIVIDDFGTTKIENAMTVITPTNLETGLNHLEVAFEAQERTVTNKEPLVAVQPEDTDGRTVYAEGELARRFADAGIAVTDALTDADIVVATTIDDEVGSFVEEDGGTAILVPAEDGQMRDESTFTYRSLPAAESWNLVASLMYQNSDLVNDLCPSARVGWAFEGIFPHEMATNLTADDVVHVGSVEGWIANWSSPLVVRDRGEGQVCSCTFRVTATYGKHPTATLLINRLIRNL